MATVLVAWELGGGLGHLVRLLPVVRRLREHDHRVFLALKDLSRAGNLFGELGIPHLQAPIKTTKPKNRIDPPRSFAHVLHNSGFDEPDELQTMTEAWCNLYRFVQPGMVVCDHAPTALLAARACGLRRAAIGTGFCCPPDMYPLPDIRPWLPEAAERLRREEDQVTANANRVLGRLQGERLGRLADLYHQADAVFLATFRELDHYPQRGEADYFGTWPNVGGTQPEWPDGSGKKVFAYVKGFRDLPKLLDLLLQLRRPAVVHVDRLDPQLQKRFESPTLRFQDRRLDLEAVGRECDLAIHNGGHGTTVSMLLSGTPQLLMPIHLEQAMTARAVARLGAGLGARLNRPHQLAGHLTSLLHGDQYAQAAAQFAGRYADYDPAAQVRRIVQRIEELAGEV